MANGKEYHGWWKESEMHGLGFLIDLEKRTKKFGVWEEGKRIKYFDKQEIA